MKANIAVNGRALLGEGPEWDPVSKRLYWVDIIGKKLHVYDPLTNENRTTEFEHSVCAVVRRQSGGLVLLLGGGIYRYNPITGAKQLLHEPESNLAGNRFNDGKCDPRGRFWAGTMSLKAEPHAGSLYCLETNGELRVKQPSVTISNGLAWHPMKPVMYYIDSPTQQVVAFDYDADTGEITNQRTVIEIPKHEGLPDGMTIDNEGKLWIAKFGGWQVGRWDPETGKKLDRIPLPASRVTSCTFGGERMNELFITTASVGLTDEDLEAQPYAGGLFRCELNVSGSPSHTFQG